MRIENKVVSKEKMFKLFMLCLMIGVALLGMFLIIFYTNGTLKQSIVRNYLFSLLLLLLPLFIYSIIGVYKFSYYEENTILTINSKCIAFGDIFSGFSQDLDIPKNHVLDYQFRNKLLGLRKVMYVTFFMNGSEKKKKFNISMLSHFETNLLKCYMQGILRRNKEG
tara:strand:- start:92 stop:589 length:498 start_codon:yes stop_codon:yes gene_type:complete